MYVSKTEVPAGHEPHTVGGPEPVVLWSADEPNGQLPRRGHEALVYGRVGCARCLDGDLAGRARRMQRCEQDPTYLRPRSERHLITERPADDRYLSGAFHAAQELRVANSLDEAGMHGFARLEQPVVIQRGIDTVRAQQHACPGRPVVLDDLSMREKRHLEPVRDRRWIHVNE
jgi:hypothetical protein